MTGTISHYKSYSEVAISYYKSYSEVAISYQKSYYDGYSQDTISLAFRT